MKVIQRVSQVINCEKSQLSDLYFLYLFAIKPETVTK